MLQMCSFSLLSSFFLCFVWGGESALTQTNRKSSLCLSELEEQLARVLELDTRDDGQVEQKRKKNKLTVDWSGIKEGGEDEKSTLKGDGVRRGGGNKGRGEREERREVYRRRRWREEGEGGGGVRLQFSGESYLIGEWHWEPGSSALPHQSHAVRRCPRWCSSPPPSPSSPFNHHASITSPSSARPPPPHQDALTSAHLAYCYLVPGDTPLDGAFCSQANKENSLGEGGRGRYCSSLWNINKIWPPVTMMIDFLFFLVRASQRQHLAFTQVVTAPIVRYQQQL